MSNEANRVCGSRAGIALGIGLMLLASGCGNAAPEVAGGKVETSQEAIIEGGTVNLQALNQQLGVVKIIPEMPFTGNHCNGILINNRWVLTHVSCASQLEDGGADGRIELMDS